MKKPEKKGERPFSNRHFKFTDGYNKNCNEWKEWFKYLLGKIPSDKEINKSPHPKYAIAYYQGKFDILMDLLREE